MAEVFTDDATWGQVLVACPCREVAQHQGDAGQPAPCPLCGGTRSAPIRRLHPAAWMCQCRAINADDGVRCGRCRRPRRGPERSLKELGMPDPGFGGA